MVDGGLELVDRGSAVEVRGADGSWLCRIESLGSTTPVGTPSPVGLLVLREVSGHVPTLTQHLVSGSTYRVVFSDDVAKGLKAGSFRLMGSGSGELATAVDGAGRIVGHGRVVQPGALAYAPALGQALAMGIGVAAALAQQRWLEETLGSIARSVERVETRLRDDDWAMLEHADHVAEECWDAAHVGEPVGQLAMELAVARTQAHTVFGSRRRWAERLISRFDEHRDGAPADGPAGPTWRAAIVRELDDPTTGVMDELGLLVKAMVTAGRTDAATAAILATEGSGAAALQVVERSTNLTRESYFELYRRFRPLARFDPDLGRLSDVVGRIPMVNRRSLAARAQRTHEQARDFFTYLDSHVGAAIPATDTGHLKLIVQIPPRSAS